MAATQCCGWALCRELALLVQLSNVGVSVDHFLAMLNPSRSCGASRGPKVWGRLSLVALALAFGACDGFAGDAAPTTGPEVPETPVPEPEPEPEPEPPEPPPPPPMARPVALWSEGSPGDNVDGAHADENGHLLIDLGEAWTPYLFTERDTTTGEIVPNDYRLTYLALARGEFPSDHHGDRARRDKYLELYGILPTLGLLRERFRHTMSLECAQNLDVQALEDLPEGQVVAYRSGDRARRDARRYRGLEQQIEGLIERHGVEDDSGLDEVRLSDRDASRLQQYRRMRPAYLAVRATQQRLECEGYFEGKGRYVEGALDWPTHEALAEFERRHRVYGWGFIGAKTRAALLRSPAEADQESVVRILTERAVHAAAVIEDGTRSEIGDRPQTYRGADGEMHPVRNLEAELREKVIAAFGLQTPESTLAFLEDLGALPNNESRIVAIENIEYPEYYSADMPLEVEIDRGDVWYEFPFDEEGRERAQHISRRPRMTIFVRHRGSRIALARLGTTIGGWRSESVDGTVMWKYKMSEIGPRVWRRIVASPVWLPPESTPARELLSRNRERGGDPYRVNYHETGPSYASAYGLVAAYHERFRERADGTISVGGDEGIRSHGSVDYMSIMRRFSHGCHRLHNHMAVRLMSFVLRRRAHQRHGQQQMAFRRELVHDDQTYLMAIDRGGYGFELNEPLRVTVREGRIRGRRMTPIPHPIPKWNSDVGAYVMPDGSPVSVDRMGNITPIVLPDAGLDGSVGDLDGGVPDPIAEIPVPDLPGVVAAPRAPIPTTMEAAPAEAAP